MRDGTRGSKTHILSISPQALGLLVLVIIVLLLSGSVTGWDGADSHG